MSRTTRRFISRWITFVPALTLLLGTAVTLVGARAGAQCTTQASGAVVLAPTNGEGQACVPGGPPPQPPPPGGPLLSGESFTMSVNIVNTSTRSTNVFPNCGTGATLTGFTHVDL